MTPDDALDLYLVVSIIGLLYFAVWVLRGMIP